MTASCRWSKGRAERTVPCRFRHVLLVAALTAVPLRAASPQLLERPWLDWRTIRAGRFAIHYPPALEIWSRFLAKRMPAVDSAVSALVGYSPRGRVDVVVEDPYAVANGLAFTFVERPVIVLWASPPEPGETIGEFRDWAELLAVHEFAHVAHLGRPSRNALTRALWRLAPVDMGPIALRAPRWVIEGYATYVEGMLTGSGRPHGVWRPAILRQWALEGRLPSYVQLSHWSDFEGDDFAYLAGSTFLEWLAQRDGDASLVHVWRRLTARVNRSFDAAFLGVYGEPPADLYGRFTAELTAKAVDADRELARAGIVDGELVQRLTWGTGAPAPSPDGSRVAVVTRSRTRPARVLVWRAAPVADTLERRARERLLRRDPEDVPARRIYPPPRRPLATLLARAGRSFEDPRWFADGKRLLLWRSTRQPDGSFRPDLYVWDVDKRSVRRVTRGAGIRNADPFPSGESAVGLRCGGGHCDVVVVELRSGATRVLAAGDTLTSYSHPRLSPDGGTVAVAMHRADRWRVALLDVAGGAPRLVDPDDGANRFDPSWSGRSALLATSDRRGTANLELIALGGASAPVSRSLTRVAGAAFAPAVNPADGSIWFLSLHSHGYDVRRLPAPTPVVEDGAAPLLDPRLTPVVPRRPVSRPVFPDANVGPSHGYVAGARITRWLPIGAVGVDGRAAGLALVSSDVVGRLSVLAQGAAGNGDAWRGGSVDGAWRGHRPQVRASAFIVRHGGSSLAPSFAAEAAATELRGGHVRADYSYAFDVADIRAGAGVSAARVVRELALSDSTHGRSLVFGEVAATARQSRDGSSASQMLSVHGTAGRGSGGGRFERVLTSLTVRTRASGVISTDLSATYGHSTGAVGAFERFVVGGLPVTLVDPSLLTQRLAMPALPVGVAAGERALTFRASTAIGALAPYYWGGSARDGPGRFERWHRVAGLELSFDQGPIAVLGTPGARIVAGIARSFDEPFADRTRGYLSIAFRP